MSEARTNRWILSVLWGLGALGVFVLYLHNCANPWNAETYPRLVPWELESELSEDSTVLSVRPDSHACPVGDEYIFETFDRVEVYETSETITIETWLGPPPRSGWWDYCRDAQGSLPFLVEVPLDAPVGTRTLIDPGCGLERHANLWICRYGLHTPKNY